MEFDFWRIQFRWVGLDGLTKTERRAIDTIVENLGYPNVMAMATDNGYKSPREMAYNHSFKNVRDYFLGRGWYDRLAEYDRAAKAVPINQS
ncbi:MAG: hypothetical protein AABW50_05255 [Nanoarchaeota archaeon]